MQNALLFLLSHEHNNTRNKQYINLYARRKTDAVNSLFPGPDDQPQWT